MVLKHSKCMFTERNISYLGHVITDDGVAIDESKIDAIKALQGFLRLIGYYWRFIHNYDIIATPLKALLEKEAFRWTGDTTTAFHTLKLALTTGPVLQLPDFSRSQRRL